jgi:hypothetical protein
MNKTEEKNTDTEEKNTDTENENTNKEKRAILINLLMSRIFNKHDEELMNAFDNQNKMPWPCD